MVHANGGGVGGRSSYGGVDGGVISLEGGGGVGTESWQGRNGEGVEDREERDLIMGTIQARNNIPVRCSLWLCYSFSNII